MKSTAPQGARNTRPLAFRAPPSAFESIEPRVLLAGQPFAEGNTIVEIETNYGSIMVELFNDAAPQTVANFLNYVNTDHYDGTFFHRLVEGFVLQGGHYFLNDHIGVQERATNAPVTNEFEVSNTVRTIAMAKLPSDPNSATDQFFFNLANNASQLDGQNGGFTVFGQVVNGWDNVLEISRLPTTAVVNPFEELPVRQGFNSVTVTNADLVTITDIQIIASPGWSQSAIVGGAVQGDGASTSASVFVTTNTLGRPISFFQPAGSTLWYISDIGLETGAPAISGAVAAWYEPRDGNFYAAAPSSQGLLLFKHNADNLWEMRNLTTEIDFATNIVSQITVFQDTSARTYIAGLTSFDASPQLVIYYLADGAPVNGNYNWAYLNLQDQLSQQGQSTPAFEGNLVSYVTTWNGLNIAGLDSAGDIHTVWWSPGETLWHTDNLSNLTGAPTYTGQLSAFVSFWGSINIVGTDLSGDVTTTWWAPDTVWQTSNLTDAFNGPQLSRGSITSYVTPWGALNIAGIDPSGEIVIYWWAPNTQTWTVSSISDLIDNAIPPRGTLRGVSSDAGPINLLGTSASGDVLRYFWTPSTDRWAMENLTAVARFL